jgi:hypothetical protein
MGGLMTVPSDYTHDGYAAVNFPPVSKSPKNAHNFLTGFTHWADMLNLKVAGKA